MKLFQNERGFSLIELVVAMLILTLVIFSIGTLITFSYRGVFSAGYKSEAQYIGQEAMENLLAVGITDPDPAAGYEFPLKFGETPIIVPGEKRIVTATYTDASGNTRTQTFTVFIPD